MADALHVFTCAAVNYLPKVRILCRSVREHHPEAKIHLALADERPDWLTAEGEPFDSVLAPSDLGIPGVRPWCFMHEIVELATAIKPFALKRLLDEAGESGTVLYFDPDIVLFSRVDDLLATLAGANVALTPHLAKPETTLDAVLDNEVSCLKHGIFNLGFCGVRATAEGRRFAQWWSERTYHLCRADVPNGLFTDQKWIDFAPVFFEGVAILRNARFNVATWNLTTRSLEGSAERGFTVDGEPLGFYHFTGFDSGAHRLMAGKHATGNAAVQQLIAWYEAEIAVAESDPISRWRWAYATYSDGTPIPRAHRHLYRDHPYLQRTYPDPFAVAAGAPSLRDWCETEGRLHFPSYFPAAAGATPAPAAPRGPITTGGALRLAMTMLAPSRGRWLRAKVADVLRHEGLAGVAKRMRGPQT